MGKQRRRQKQDNALVPQEDFQIKGTPHAKRRLNPDRDPYQTSEAEIEELLEQREGAASEDMNRLSGAYLGSSGEVDSAGDEPETDFHQYDDEADPARDEDSPYHHGSEEYLAFQQLPAESYFGEPGTPKPAIIFEWAGDRMEVRVPLEKYTSNKSAGMYLGKKIRDLRILGEKVLEHNYALFLEPVMDVENLREKIARIKQVEMIKCLGEDVEKHKGAISRLIQTEYLQGRSTGVIPLSWFFFAKEETEGDVIRQKITAYVQQVLAREYVNSPLDNKGIWAETKKLIEKNEGEELRDKCLDALLKAKRYDFQNFRNWLEKAGIPLACGRKQIYDKVTEYLGEQKPESVSVTEIPGLNARLKKKYGLFKGKSKGRTAVTHYDNEVFNAFVEQRILRILEFKHIQVVEV